jgi:methanogenic corrinoid protein MtbC1
MGMMKSTSITKQHETRPASQPDPATLVSIGQVVSELQQIYPDVTHSSLRFLERERLITPARTAGGHRLYSRGDVERIRQIKAWQTQRLSLEEIRGRLDAQHDLTVPSVLAERFLATTLSGDRAGAVRVVMDADELGMPLAQLFEDALRPALYEVGARWEAGTLPVGHEKEVSELARDLIAQLSSRHADPDPQGPVVVAACVAGERHELGLRMIVGLLRERGWRVHFLGADVDSRFLQERVQQWRPTCVLLSATRAERLPDLESAIQAVRAASAASSMPIVVGGGQLAPEHADTLRAWGAIPASGDGLDALLSAIPTPASSSEGEHI